MKEPKVKPLIWVNEEQSEFYLSHFDIHEYSFLDDLKIKELISVITLDHDGNYGECYSNLDPRQSEDNNLVKDLVGRTYTQPLQSQIILPFYYAEYDVILNNGLGARKVLGDDILLYNSTPLKNFKLLLQQLDVKIRTINMQPNKLYLLDKNKLWPTQFSPTNILDFVLRRPEVFGYYV
jgi:hypothetical protein